MSVTGFKILRVGRGPLAADGRKNDVQVVHPSVSRSHLEVFIDAEDNVFITDLQSRNGTYVNGNRITGNYLLKAGDILKLGSSKPVPWKRWLDQDLENTPDPGSLSDPGAHKDRSATTVFSGEEARRKKRQLLLLGLLGLVVLLGTAGWFFYTKRPSGETVQDKEVVGAIKKYNLESIKTLRKAELLGAQVDGTVKDGARVECAEGQVLLSIEKGEIKKVSDADPGGSGTDPDPNPDPGNENSDRDQDGVPDKEDKCPDEKGSKANKGCKSQAPAPVNDKDKDSDQDGVPDKDDKCPNEKGSKANDGCKNTQDNSVYTEFIQPGETPRVFYSRMRRAYPGCKYLSVDKIVSQCGLASENDPAPNVMAVRFLCN